MIRFALAVLLSGAFWAGAARGAETRPAGGGAILDECSSWRAFCTWRTPVVGSKGSVAETKAHGFIVRSAAPPAGWPEPDFADAQWSRWQAMGERYGFKERGSGDPALAVQCLRGRFLVEDPGRVQGLTLTLAFRGGAAVYVNGKEVTRAFLPREGALAPETLADDYPLEAFEHAEAIRNSKCILAEFSQPAQFKDQVEKRVRKIENLAIEGKLLRKGVNILAVEIHRAAYQGNGLDKENMNHNSVWSTCGLVDLELRAAAGIAPNSSRPAGVQAWVQSPMQRSSPGDWADPLEPPGAVSIIGCRNGVFDGKVTVSSAGALGGVKATVSDLVAKGGGRIPAANLKVLYSVRDDRNALRYRVANGFWDTLLEAPPAEVQPVKAEKGPALGAVQPIVIKVRVPAEAAPGDYEGKLSVSPGAGSPVEVPVRLKVLDWKLPDPRDFTVHLGIIESPESVAMWYKVPLWSEEHWKLIERSFALLGEVGNKVVVIPMLCRTNFGNAETPVRWIKDGDKYKYDFAAFDRYLDLAQKHLKPDVVWLYVWDRYAGQTMWAGKGEQPRKGAAVTVLDPAGKKTEEFEGPHLGTPEGRAFWEPLYKEVRARLEKRGLLGVTMMGVNGDAYWPSKDVAEMFREIMPGVKWVNNSHADTRGGNTCGIPVGYNTSVYINFFPPPGGARGDKGAKDGRYYGWKYKTDIFPRSHGPALDQPLYHSSTLAQHRAELEGALLANCSGIGRVGADFWEVLAPPRAGTRTTGKRSETIIGRYQETCWNQLNMNTSTEAFLAPGPEGAVSTERFENLREGAQLCEARILIERALLDGKLPADLAARCQELLDERAWHLRSACAGNAWGWNWWQAASPGLDEKLFAAAGEVAAKTGGQ